VWGRQISVTDLKKRITMTMRTGNDKGSWAEHKKTCGCKKTYQSFLTVASDVIRSMTLGVVPLSSSVRSR